MVKCPNCSTDITDPYKSLKNNVFHIEAYTCNKCNYSFKVTNEFVFLNEKLSAH